jgi:uncharacterized protein (TIRG00374 family)
VSVILAGDLISKINIKIYVFLFFVLLVVIFYLFQREEPARYFVKILEKIRYRKLAEIFSKLHTSIIEYKKYPKTILLSFFFTILAHVTRVFIYYFVALSLNIPVPLIYFFLFIPLITLIIMVPISIGGLGVGEGAFVAFFMLIGISLNNCLIMAFTNTIINTFFTLLGGVVYLFYNHPVKKESIRMKNAKLSHEIKR